MSRHMKGPWTAMPSEGPMWGAWIRPANPHNGPVAIQCGANANLIAAAPDLYDVLEEVMWLIDQSSTQPDSSVGRLIIRCRAVIARAKGEK